MYVFVCVQVMNASDVIYADIILPAASDRLWVQEHESTEYACVMYKQCAVNIVSY